jgi:hypothetical protein
MLLKDFFTAFRTDYGFPFRGFEITCIGHTTHGRTPLGEWSARHRDLYTSTHTKDGHPCLRWDSNPQSQPSSGRRPTPQTQQPLGPALQDIKININELISYAYSHKIRLQITAQFQFSWTERFADCQYKWGWVFSYVNSTSQISKQFRGQWHWILSTLMSACGDSSQNAGRLQSDHFIVSPDLRAEERRVAFGSVESCIAILCIGRGVRDRYCRFYWLRHITDYLVALFAVLCKKLVLKLKTDGR